MKLASLSAILSLLAITSALPTAIPEPSPLPAADLAARQGSSQNNMAACNGIEDTNFTFKWSIETLGPAFATDWGKGLLDNLRGQCGLITNWGYTYEPDGTGLAVFNTNTIIPGGCVENAVWLATNPTGAVWGMHCNLDTTTKAELGG